MLRGLSAAVFIAGRGVPGCGSPLLRDRKAAAVIYPPLLPNPIKWRSSGPGRRGAREPGGAAGRTGPRRGGQTAPQRVADLALFTAAALFLFFIFYGGLVSFPRPSRAAFKHDAWMAGVWTGGEVGRPCCPPSKGVARGLSWETKRPRGRDEGREAPLPLLSIG